MEVYMENNYLLSWIDVMLLVLLNVETLLLL